MRGVVWLMALLALAGCDRDSSAPPPPVKRPTVTVVEVTRVTPLPAQRRTHVAPSGAGQVFWVQEADGGREQVFAIADNGLPGATKFSNAAVLEAAGEPAGKGSIESLAVGADQKVYFYFSGGTRRKLVAALGYFVPVTGKTVILADTAKLADVSRMGNALALARGSLVRNGDVIWLWLRHPDGYAMLSVDVTRPGSALRRPFERALEGEGEVRLTSAGEDLAAGPGGSLVYVDRAAGRLWRIEPLGEAAAGADAGELPVGTTTPSLDERGRLVMFAPEAEPMVEQPEGLATTRKAPEWPGVVVLDGGSRTVLGRGAIEGPSGINVRSLAPAGLVRDRNGWLAYDAPTGELLRVRVAERER
jgi:hypothetical protein